jgi:hypothetical protein
MGRQDRAVKIGGILRTIAAILEMWDTLDPADQCNMGEIARRLIVKAVKRINQMKDETPELVSEDDLIEFSDAVNVVEKLIESIPPHTHDEPS